MGVRGNVPDCTRLCLGLRLSSVDAQCSFEKLVAQCWRVLNLIVASYAMGLGGESDVCPRGPQAA